MAARFTYSRWDGTQRGFDLDADALLAEITDDLLYHGDVNAALRRMMNQGMRDRDGSRDGGVHRVGAVHRRIRVPGGVEVRTSALDPHPSDAVLVGARRTRATSTAGATVLVDVPVIVRATHRSADSR